MDYKFGRKNNWRRWLWNRIDERLRIPAKDALVIYLGGLQDLDRREARRHGFRDVNMICVDWNKKIVSNLRASGSLAIHAPLYDTLINWNPSRPIDVVVGDFMSDWSSCMLQGLSHLWMHKHLADATVAMNFLRGRCASSNAERKQTQALLVALFENTDRAFKHRGALFALYSAWTMILRLNDGCDWSLVPEDDQRRIGLFLQDFMRCVSFDTYRSGTQLFDSVVYAYRLTDRAQTDDAVGQFISRLWEAQRRVRPNSAYLDIAIQRKIAATLAHRTRRAA